VSDLTLFAYGSLLFEPERADALLGLVPATWHGVRRSFNKTSTGRGCALDASRAPALPAFIAKNRRLSLVLGTEPGDRIDGFILRYEAAHADDVMRRVNAREGFDPTRASALNDYLPTPIEVTLQGGQRASAVAWKTNPHCRAYVGDLSIDTVASVLRAATPDAPGDRAQGTAYLEGVRQVLRSSGRRDHHLDHVSLAIRALG
jgi:cation transport regulator ChaC